MASVHKVIRVIELFSGIGGFHLALKSMIASSDTLKHHQLKVYPFDNNGNANKVYEHNFNVKPNAKNIEHLNHTDFDAIRPSIITLSPPCQPYTRAGIQNDSRDQRANALHHFCTEILLKMQHLPQFIMLENVLGFETSHSCQVFLQCLIQRGYKYQIYCIDPTQIGIPNTRKRIYVLATATNTEHKNDIDSKLENGPEISIEIIKELPMHNFPRYCIGDVLHETDNIKDSKQDEEEKKVVSYDEYAAPLEKLMKCKGYKFDVACTLDHNSACFTKAYATKKNYCKGTGSLFAWKLTDKEMIAKFKAKYDALFDEEANEGNHEKIVALLSSVGIRYFTPRECALLMGFPRNFSFPMDLNDNQLYKLIGNSINVPVVTVLLTILCKQSWW